MASFWNRQWTNEDLPKWCFKQKGEESSKDGFPKKDMQEMDYRFNSPVWMFNPDWLGQDLLYYGHFVFVFGCLLNISII